MRPSGPMSGVGNSAPTASRATAAPQTSAPTTTTAVSGLPGMTFPHFPLAPTTVLAAGAMARLLRTG